MIESMYRRSVLGVADTRLIAMLIKRLGFKLGVGRFVAGEDLPQALDALQTLKNRVCTKSSICLANSWILKLARIASLKKFSTTLDRLESEQIDRYMSIKPTQLGLGIRFDFALNNARRVAKRAQEIEAQICLDMESAEYVDGTLKMLRTLQDEGYTNISTVLQSYLYRTMDDLKTMLADNPRQAVRIVKGAYRESPRVAYPDKSDVDANYRALVRYAFEQGAKVNIATHDETITDDFEAYIREHHINAERYEFQMLYGVRLSLQKALVARGHTVRIYVPYGQDWYGYFTRRLAERPCEHDVRREGFIWLARYK